VALLGAVVGGSLDRAMDVAATLELRGFAAGRLEIARSSIGRRPPRRSLASRRLLRRLSPAFRSARGSGHAGMVHRGRPWSRHDLAFACSALAVVALAVLGRFGDAAPFQAYPLVHMPVTVGTLALCAALIVAILLPFCDRRGIDP
jgi:energy-coupling factor transport system permease protein